ncbi:protein APCDD1-like [Saccostrea echinata]|uniref:protein APCDD1-like n=1 Tax=Saccostrea echinata TaxID=191078 RepID=UPI002A80F077|nr:protein APCDD1-like [Saccostrea echinata]
MNFKRTLLCVAVLLEIGIVTSYYHLYREKNWRNKSCSHILKRIGHLSIEAPQPPHIAGEWSSHRCEVRPGPEFILRKYHFRRHHFKLHQYYYKDLGCKHPAYGVVAEGQYRHQRPSWIVQGGTETAYTVHNVSIIPYAENIAKKFTKISKLCSEISNTNFSTFRKTQILNFPPFSRNSHASKDYDCSFVFNLTFHELQLIRMEIQHHHVFSSTKYFRLVKARRARSDKELFLGDVHTDIKQRASYRPTAYQAALKPAHTRKCHVCSVIANSHDFLPPQLKSNHFDDFALPGEWVSTRCETRQYGQFLTRHLTFHPDGRSWNGQYDFYTDPVCLHSSFSLVVKGTYATKANFISVLGAKKCNFQIHNLKVKPMSQTITQSLNIFGGQGCGRPHSWENGVEQDVTSSGGCVSLGIVLQTVEHEVLKIEKINNKRYLYIGQRPSDRSVRPLDEWPTSFQDPLIQCSSSRVTPKKVRPKMTNTLPKFQRLQSPSSTNNIHGCIVQRVFLVVVSSFLVGLL